MSNLDNEFEPLPGDAPGGPVLSSNLVYLIDGADVSLTGTYQTVYTYTGSGKLVMYTATVEAATCSFKLTVDSNVIFDLALIDLAEATGNKEYTTDGLFCDLAGKILTFVPKHPVAFGFSVLVEAKDSTSKKLFIDLVGLTKET